MRRGFAYNRLMGRIDTHSHILPGVDDGCQTLEESVRCANALVEAGYTHAFCTPHIWPNLPENRMEIICRRTESLQKVLADRGIPLRLFPGGEMNLRPGFVGMPAAEVVTYANAGKYVIFDLWAEQLPDYFEPAVRWLQSLGLTVILAHPERMRAVQEAPELADQFANLGLLLQGNLQCFADPLHSHTRQTAERFLAENRYFMLGSDCHGPDSLPIRLRGLDNARQLAGSEQFDLLTIHNPARLLPA